VLLCAVVFPAFAEPPQCAHDQRPFEGRCIYNEAEASLRYWKGRPAKLALATGLVIQHDEGVSVTAIGPLGRVQSDSAPWSRRGIAPGLYDVRLREGNNLVLRRRVVVDVGKIVTVEARSGKAQSGGGILVNGLRYQLGAGVNVVTWEDTGGFDIASMCQQSGNDIESARCVRPRDGAPDSLELLRATVDTVVVSADHSMDVQRAVKNHTLRSNPPVSTHFIINWDGTIHQLADASLRCFHGYAINDRSIGVDLNGQLVNLLRARKVSPKRRARPWF
jgi:hypothetical protein